MWPFGTGSEWHYPLICAGWPASSSYLIPWPTGSELHSLSFSHEVSMHDHQIVSDSAPFFPGIRDSLMPWCQRVSNSAFFLLSSLIPWLLTDGKWHCYFDLGGDLITTTISLWGKLPFFQAVIWHTVYSWQLGSEWHCPFVYQALITLHPMITSLSVTFLFILLGCFITHPMTNSKWVTLLLCSSRLYCDMTNR